MKRKSSQAPEPVTYEDFRTVAYERFISWNRDRYPQVPPANIFYRVGDPVNLGRGRDVYLVEGVLDEGKLIHVSRHDAGVIGDKPYDNHRRLPVFAWWYELEPVAPVKDTHLSRPRIHVQYHQSDLYVLLHRCYSRGLADSPDYQRDYVWTLEDKQRLVRSVFNRTDIGKFIFLEREEDNRLEVIDGKQRLRALMDYYEGRFPYEGVTYHELSWLDKRSFFDILVQTADLQEARVKKSDILWLFLTVNSGGVPQTQEHIQRTQLLYEEALKSEIG